MTDEQINAAIAEACGWKGNVLDRDMEGNLWPSYPPRYCTDLNAMHQAEKVLNQDNLYIMALHIEELCGRGEFYFRATARQRAEAFLKTLGLWKEVAE